MSPVSEILRLRDRCRRGLIRHTARAYSMLPPLERPSILDLGCGSGAPALELAALSGGRVWAVDVDGAALELLAEKIAAGGPGARITAINSGADELDLPEGRFDIVWAEGLFNVIGFARGLHLARRFLKPRGFCVIHDEEADMESKRNAMRAHGFELLDFFLLDQEVWWNDYYRPLEEGLARLDRSVPENDRDAKDAAREIEDIKRHPESFRSVFYIARLKEAA